MTRRDCTVSDLSDDKLCLSVLIPHLSQLCDLQGTNVGFNILFG